jgi:uncharacterized protein (DUF362 family)
MKTHLEGTKPTINLAMKNMFGLIPDPVRFKYHGRYGDLLDISTVDINKIYHAIFPVVGIVEAFPSAIVYHPHGSINARWGNYDLIDDCNFLIYSDSLIELDYFGSRIFDFNPENIGIFKEAGEQFGNWRTAKYPEIPAEIQERFKPLVQWKLSTGKTPGQKPPPIQKGIKLGRKTKYTGKSQSRDRPPSLTPN